MCLRVCVRACQRACSLTLQQLVQLLGARGDLDDLCTPLVELCCRGEAHGYQLGRLRLPGNYIIIITLSGY